MKTCPTCQRTYDDNMKFCQNDGATLVADDPFKTMVAGQPLTPDDDPLEIPSFDPNKTMVASSQEQADMLGSSDPFAGMSQPQSSYSDPIPSPSDPFASPSSTSSYNEPDTAYMPPPSPSSSPFDSPFASPSAPETQQFGGAQPTQDWSAPPAPAPQWQDQGNFGANTPFQPPGAAAGQKSGLAIASMITGILSCLCCFSIITGPAGLIMGIMARNKANSDPMNYGGAGMAMAGIICGSLGTLLGVLGIILQLSGALARMMR